MSKFSYNLENGLLEYFLKNIINRDIDFRKLLFIYKLIKASKFVNMYLSFKNHSFTRKDYKNISSRLSSS